MFTKSITPRVPLPLPTSMPKLAPCPDCEHQISLKAFACPHCGCPVPHHAEIARLYPEVAGNGWRYRLEQDGSVAVLTDHGVEARYRSKDFWKIVKYQSQQSRQSNGPRWWFGINFPI